jgi:xanthine dehydrogenase accessory factor
MNELNRLITAATQAHSYGTKAALVTVVATHGSVYRRAGARMLVLNDGHTVGAISGGCLERDACAHARDVMHTGTSTSAVVTYDTTSDADIVWGLGLGCNGVVRVLVEPLEGVASPVVPRPPCARPADGSGGAGFQHRR